MNGQQTMSAGRSVGSSLVDPQDLLCVDHTTLSDLRQFNVAGSDFR